ncbi:MAG: hypothetical protein Q8K00_08385 [Syntrophales bacterium]|nr:hypothetical protein [Syntrophales bacterium]
MNHEEKIRELEGQLEAEEAKIKAFFLSAKIPAPGDYAERDRIRGELKTARRMKTADEKRTDPKLTRSYTITFSEDEFADLTRRAEKERMILSKYIRCLLKSGG